jgi:hypothetical protein
MIKGCGNVTASSVSHRKHPETTLIRLFIADKTQIEQRQQKLLIHNYCSQQFTLL